MDLEFGFPYVFLIQVAIGALIHFVASCPKMCPRNSNLALWRNCLQPNPAAWSGWPMKSEKIMWKSCENHVKINEHHMKLGRSCHKARAAIPTHSHHWQVEPGGEFLVCLARACEALPLQSLKSLADLEHWTSGAQDFNRFQIRTIRTIRIQVFRGFAKELKIFFASFKGHSLRARSFAWQLKVIIFQAAAGKQWQTACNQHAKMPRLRCRTSKIL